MAILCGFINVFLGVVLVWMGSFQIITAMLPKDFAMTVAEKHGAWMRENVFNLPPIEEKK